MAKNKNLIGSWAFLIGLILAVVVGIFGIQNETILIILVISGIVVGLLNITAAEVTPFLFSGTVLIIVSGIGQSIMAAVPYVEGILPALLAIFVPATIIVAIKNVFALGRN